MSTAIAATLKQNRVRVTGLLLLLLSLLIFCLPILSPKANFNDGFFFLNYIFSIIYFVVLFADHRLRRGNRDLAAIFLLLTLALVSCFALNRGVRIFEVSTTWWSTLLIICCINYTTILFFDRLPS